MKYLNDTGVSYLITKIKTWLAGKSDTNHTHKTSELTNDSSFITGDITRIEVVTEYPATEENGVLYILAGT